MVGGREQGTGNREQGNGEWGMGEWGNGGNRGTGGSRLVSCRPLKMPIRNLVLQTETLWYWASEYLIITTNYELRTTYSPKATDAPVLTTSLSGLQRQHLRS